MQLQFPLPYREFEAVVSTAKPLDRLFEHLERVLSLWLNDRDHLRLLENTDFFNVRIHNSKVTVMK